VSVHWTTPIMEEIDAMEWGDGYPSDHQRDEMKKLVIRWRQLLEHVLGLYEAQWHRGGQTEEITLDGGQSDA